MAELEKLLCTDSKVESLKKINAIIEKGGGGLEIGDIGFTQMAIDEAKGKRRILNGQLIIQEQYVQFTNIVKDSVALNPDLACTEDEWQTSFTMSANGVCYKFVIDDEAGTIRLPKYPDYFVAGLTGNAPVVGNGNALGLSLNNGQTEYVGLSRSGASGDYGWVGYTTTSDHVTSPRPSTPIKAGTEIGTGFLNIGYGGHAVFGVSTKEGYSGLISNLSNDQTEQIKGTYFIQVATGAETEDNIINEIELNNPFSLLDYKYSEYELNNLSWLRSEGQYNSKAIYPAVYDLLLKIYNGTEAKTGVSVKLSTETFTDYDFVLNTAEETFRLPIKVKLASGKAVVGNGSNIGMEVPENGNQGNIYLFNAENTISSLGAKWDSNVANQTYIGLSTDPTKSGIETSDNGLYLYFYVGETVQNANLINAGRIEEKLADKTDKVQASLASMPSDKYIDLTVGASGTIYVAPANGYVDFIRTCASTNEFVAMATISENGADLLHTKSTAGTANNTANVYAPVKKGDSFKIVYTATGTAINSLRFIYAEGDQ